MKHLRNSLMLMALVFVAISCKNPNEPADDTLIGFWEPSISHELGFVFLRGDTLSSDEYGFEFRNGGVFIEQDMGPCGTPPHYFTSQHGTYQRDGDTLYITVDYWGGYKELVWRINSIEGNVLEIEVISEEFFND